MSTYFKIQPITIATSPFETKEVNAIEWIITSVQRGVSSALIICNLASVDETENVIDRCYEWRTLVPNNILSQWLDDSVIDNYICSLDSRFIKV